MDDPNMHAYGEDGPTDAEIGRQWRENSSLEKWFPITAERLAALEVENAALKRDLQYARDGLTKGRSRMREDNERLAREAYTWSKAAEAYAADAERFRWLAERTVATGLARWVHPFQFLAEAVDKRRIAAAPRVTTAAELRQQAKSDTSCVGAFARARPGKA